ncbi:helix-turn-helix transcriptional regulator [Tabrizicola sp. DMG-N-6]|uniref:Helix-turn-helix transcriptional regulator n=2 Tax=Szabonella alba TaxID=2804194 RepID=A0A8K0VFV8_9RHOB|nr:helix-turn-helix transcriptional regulator [Szabonella alba]
MESRIHALRALAPLTFRQISGAVADVWSVHGDQGGGGHYIAPDPRIVIFLDDAPPPLSLRLSETAPAHKAVQASYIPAGVPLWSRMERSGTLNHIDLHLEASALQRRLSATGVRADLTQPRLLETTPQLVALGRLAAAEVVRPRRGAMLLDSLIDATLAEFFAEPGPCDADDGCSCGSGGLAPWQMTAVERHFRANLSRPVPVAELARAARLSESWFSHCFRMETGETPHRWQARQRLLAACTLMENSVLPLAEIAQATGFADQAHLSRSFRATHGMPPSAWRRTRIAMTGIPSD